LPRFGFLLPLLREAFLGLPLEEISRDKLTNAFVGLVIVVAGWAVLALAGQFFGWESILLPSSVIEKIRFGAN